MTQTTQFTIGADAVCTDGPCGEVSRVVIDPVRGEVTHLVVEPKHRHSDGRLVPLDLLDLTSGAIRLRCTTAEFDQLDPAEERHFLPHEGGYGGYSRGQFFMWPYFSGAVMGTNMGVGGSHAGIGTDEDFGDLGEAGFTDTVPVGEVAVYRGDRVHATDGEIGRVHGLVMSTGNHAVTHVLLQEGHLFGRKDVAIPIAAVTWTADGIRLNITKEQVQELPAVNLAHPNG